MQQPQVTRRQLGGGTAASRTTVTFKDVEKTGPGTLAGEYLRLFWQPVAHAADVAVGEAKPIRIMSEDFTLYRGRSGQPYVVASRCAHRAMPLHVGWVEGEEIRCFYHGWKYNGMGACTEQPPEKPPFSRKIAVGGFPAREYLGLIFAYFGPGEPPEFPRFPSFEGDEWVLNHDSYTRACHFFNNLENAGDISHIAFAHHDASISWDEMTDGPLITADESCWGVTFRAVRPSGKEIISQFGMPNMFHVRGVPDDPEVQYREFVAWWVPHDDDRHTQFTVAKQPAHSPVTARYQQRRAEKLAAEDLDREQIARDLLAGKIGWKDVDPKRVNMIFLQDDVAQMGVGLMSERDTEHLGRGDAGPRLQRKLWMRELTKFGRGEPLTQWRHVPEELPVKAEF